MVGWPPPSPTRASSTTATLLAAPLRWPRPSALEAPLKVTPQKSADAAAQLGLLTVGDLLEHLPRDRREARTVATLSPDDVATVVVEVRSITSRPVRRRGMKPLVEATVADETGVMKATFFNQPWLQRKYPAGTRLVLHGKYAARNAFRVTSHAPTDESTGSAERGRALPGDGGAVLDADPRARARPPGRRRARRRAAARAGAHAHAGRPARPARGDRRRARRRSRGRPAPPGLRRAAARPALAAAPPRPAPRVGRGAGARRAACRCRGAGARSCCRSR